MLRIRITYLFEDLDLLVPKSRIHPLHKLTNECADPLVIHHLLLGLLYHDGLEGAFVTQVHAELILQHTSIISQSKTWLTKVQYKVPTEADRLYYKF